MPVGRRGVGLSSPMRTLRAEWHLDSLAGTAQPLLSWPSCTRTWMIQKPVESDCRELRSEAGPPACVTALQGKTQPMSVIVQEASHFSSRMLMNSETKSLSPQAPGDLGKSPPNCVMTV